MLEPAIAEELPKIMHWLNWGSKLLAGLGIARGSPKKRCKGQMGLPWDSWEAENAEILAVAIKFVGANALNPKIALMMLG